MDKKITNSVRVALLGIMTALVTVGTVLFQIPIPSTSGYFNLGESMVYISAILFGPGIGGFAGGVGSMLADLILGYPVYAPWTLLTKGIEGIIVGSLSNEISKYIQKISSRKTQLIIETIPNIIAILIGGTWMVLSYFFFQQCILGYFALPEVPFNVIQMAAGMIIALPVSHIIKIMIPELFQ
ncbi:MAG: ECF transporter S component [Candidatus Ranarchaeia archaeon]